MCLLDNLVDEIALLLASFLATLAAYALGMVILVYHFGVDWNISTTIGLIAQFCTDVHGPDRMKSTDVGDPLTFLPSPS